MLNTNTAIFLLLSILILDCFVGIAQDTQCYLGGGEFYADGKKLDKYSPPYGGYIKTKKYKTTNDSVKVIFNYYSLQGNNDAPGFFMVHNSNPDLVYSGVNKLSFRTVDGNSIFVTAHKIGFKKIILKGLQVSNGDSIVVDGFFEPTVEKYSHFDPYEEEIINELKEYSFKEVYNGYKQENNYIQGRFAIISGQIKTIKNYIKNNPMLLFENDLVIPVDTTGRFNFRVKLPDETCITQIKIGINGYRPIATDKIQIKEGDSLFIMPVLKRK